MFHKIILAIISPMLPLELEQRKYVLTKGRDFATSPEQATQYRYPEIVVSDLVILEIQIPTARLYSQCV